jgi:KUP system potassium uptake protein
MSTHQSAGGTTGTRFAALALAALGVVYGDIGTSPLYAVKEVFAGNHPIPVTTANIYGSLSLFFWALVIVVSVKYVTFIMRADNRGEGGIMALIALALHTVQDKPHHGQWIMIVGVLGAAMFYGDGMVTPAISVLSAVEGLEVGRRRCKPSSSRSPSSCCSACSSCRRAAPPWSVPSSARSCCSGSACWRCSASTASSTIRKS